MTKASLEFVTRMLLIGVAASCLGWPLGVAAKSGQADDRSAVVSPVDIDERPTEFTAGRIRVRGILLFGEIVVYPTDVAAYLTDSQAYGLRIPVVFGARAFESPTTADRDLYRALEQRAFEPDRFAPERVEVLLEGRVYMKRYPLPFRCSQETAEEREQLDAMEKQERATFLIERIVTAKPSRRENRFGLVPSTVAAPN